MKIKMINIMSALQLQETGHCFVHAPCQYSAQQVREFAAKAESESQMGVGMMSHQDFKQEMNAI